jgi:hypothetical protein
MWDDEALYFQRESMENKILHHLMKSTLTKEIDQTKCIKIDDIVSLIQSLDTLLAWVDMDPF